jgi:hypothetical protein
MSGEVCGDSKKLEFELRYGFDKVHLFVGLSIRTIVSESTIDAVT